MKNIKAIVTGSTSGIGKEITSLLLKSGASVIGLARDHKKFQPDFDNYFPVAVDLSDLEKAERIIPKTTQFNTFCIKSERTDFEQGAIHSII